MITLTLYLMNEILDFIKCYDFVFKAKRNNPIDLFISHPIADTTIKYLPYKKPDCVEDIQNAILDLTDDVEKEIYYTWLSATFTGQNFENFFWGAINKPYRIAVLAYFVGMLKAEGVRLNKKKIARMFIESYESIELPFQDKSRIKYLYDIIKGVNMQDYAVTFDIPMTDIIVYRGQKEEIEEIGLSWTLEYSNAMFFAGRWNFDGKGKILTAKIDREDIWYISNNRNEKEIILKPTALKSIKKKIIDIDIIEG